MITIRNAARQDVPRILEIFNESVSPVWTQDTIQGELEKNDSLFLVAVKSTEKQVPCVVGFAVFRQVGDDGELLQIATCKTARRKGVADKLMCAVLDYSTQKKYESIHLEVRFSNKPAINLYEKHGFKTVRIRKDYYTSPTEDAIVMVKERHGHLNDNFSDRNIM